MCFSRKSHVLTDKLDVQETDFCFTQFYGSHSTPNQTNKTKDEREPLGKLYGKHSIKHAKTDHQS